MSTVQQFDRIICFLQLQRTQEKGIRAIVECNRVCIFEYVIGQILREIYIHIH